MCRISSRGPWCNIRSYKWTVTNQSLFEHEIRYTFFNMVWHLLVVALTSHPDIVAPFHTSAQQTIFRQRRAMSLGVSTSNKSHVFYTSSKVLMCQVNFYVLCVRKWGRWPNGTHFMRLWKVAILPGIFSFLHYGIVDADGSGRTCVPFKLNVLAEVSLYIYIYILLSRHSTNRKGVWSWLILNILLFGENRKSPLWLHWAYTKWNTIVRTTFVSAC